jgi:hypothetical protein
MIAVLSEIESSPSSGSQMEPRRSIPRLMSRDWLQSVFRHPVTTVSSTGFEKTVDAIILDVDISPLHYTGLWL